MARRRRYSNWSVFRPAEIDARGSRLGVNLADARAAKLPNFIIAGAPTSGTTSLYHHLRQHPQVFLCPIKEPMFFAAIDVLSWEGILPTLERQRPALTRYLAGPQEQKWEQAWVTNWEDYVQLFRNARDQIALGEASVGYIRLPSAAPAIRSVLPGVRLIFMLRDPTERLFSAYFKLRSRGLRPDVTFRAWVLEAMNSGEDRRLRMYSNPIPLDGGMYAMHLKRFFDIFPRDQVRIYLYESFRADPQAVLRDILAFLGVDPHQPIDTSHRLNETLVLRFPALAGLRQRILGKVSLTRWLPAPAVHAFRRIYYQRRGWIAIVPDDRRMVIDYYHDEILRTADLIGADLSSWLR